MDEKTCRLGIGEVHPSNEVLCVFLGINGEPRIPRKFGHPNKRGEKKAGRISSHVCRFVVPMMLWLKIPSGQKEFLRSMIRNEGTRRDFQRGRFSYHPNVFPFDGMFWSLFVFGWNDCHEFQETSRCLDMNLNSPQTS